MLIQLLLSLIFGIEPVSTAQEPMPHAERVAIVVTEAERIGPPHEADRTQVEADSGGESSQAEIFTMLRWVGEAILEQSAAPSSTPAAG